MEFIPYGKQIIDDKDIEAVVSVLKSDWLTTGPLVGDFEKAICQYTGASYGVAVSSGTAALHIAMMAFEVEEGDEVIVSPMTFAASANAILYCGAKPVFADIKEDSLLIDPVSIEDKITSRTKGIVAVDYAGQPCDWDALRSLADKHDLFLLADSCHALGAEYKGQKVGTLADISIFSFHPVKHITTGEGGMCVTDKKKLAEKMKLYRSHGISSDARSREQEGAWFYEMLDLGYNYRITDIQCALGLSQLKKLPGWIKKRNELALVYDEAFKNTGVVPLAQSEDILNAYHLYVVKVAERDRAYKKLRDYNIGANVHYIPVHMHPYYQQNLGTHKGMCPVAEKAYEEILTIPLWPGLGENELKRVIDLLFL